MKAVRIETSPFQVLALVEFESVLKKNQHGCAKVSGYISAEEKDQLMAMISEETWAHIWFYDETGEIKENNYSNIYTINVISSSDLVNWTDHGSVYAASEKGAASWGTNSWAPAAACREIDGKMKFFLYFANGGNGIAVLSSDLSLIHI